MATSTVNMRDVSVRVRTLGRKRGAAILSIGAVFFDRRTGKIGQEFYQEIGSTSALKGSALESEPMQWWAEHSDECKALIKSHENKLDLATTLDRFNSWMRNAASGVPIPWGYGVSDLAILEEAYCTGTVGLHEPWHYANVRSFITIYDVATSSNKDAKIRFKSSTTSHALQAAKDNADAICQCFAALAGKPVVAAPIDDDEL